jgi:hypothetical protein
MCKGGNVFNQMGPLERASLNLQRLYVSITEKGLVSEALCLQELTKMDTPNIQINNHVYTIEVLYQIPKNV